MLSFPSKSDDIVQTDFPLSQDQVNQYHQQGFLQLPNFFSLKEIQLLQTVVDRDFALEGKQTIRYDPQKRKYRFTAWNELGDSLFGVIPRLARMVDGATSLLGEECYHWHSKIVTKDPGGGKLNWHQDYAASWYEDGCLFPDLVNCSIAINESNQQNGCLRIAVGSHLLGRLNTPPDCPYRDSDPDRVEKVLERLDVVDCEMKPGDALFFHANTLHSSESNNTNYFRNLMYCTYNAASNEPVVDKGQEHHRYAKINKLPDSTIEDGKYDNAEKQQFFPPEAEDSEKMSIFYRAPKT